MYLLHHLCKAYTVAHVHCTADVCDPSYISSYQNAQKDAVGEEAHAVEHCNQLPDKTLPWHSGSQAA